jgi:hypothetical protein
MAVTALEAGKDMRPPEQESSRRLLSLLGLEESVEARQRRLDIPWMERLFGIRRLDGSAPDNQHNSPPGQMQTEIDGQQIRAQSAQATNKFYGADVMTKLLALNNEEGSLIQELLVSSCRAQHKIEGITTCVNEDTYEGHEVKCFKDDSHHPVVVVRSGFDDHPPEMEVHFHQSGHAFLFGHNELEANQAALEHCVDVYPDTAVVPSFAELTIRAGATSSG